METLGPGNAPRLLYRVYVSDGHEELVRGAVFNELDVRAMRSDLIAAGNDPLISNRTGGAPTTIISPSLLFGELEVKRADTSKDKLPEYPAPPLATATASASSANHVFRKRLGVHRNCVHDAARTTGMAKQDGAASIHSGVGRVS